LRVEPQDVLITSGFTQGLGLVARSVASKGVRRIAMEVPSMALHRSIARAAGHELVLIPVDGEGMRVDELEGASGVGLVVLTPNRQHPSGVSLSPARRSRLLAWARANKSLVLEDDYDGEFRYDLRPLGPLQSLDPSVVVYAGTASKTLAPGVRIGWLAIPPQMRQDVIHQKTLADWHSSAFEQLAFAEMLRTAAYDRHIRKMRLVYRRRRDALLGALREANPSLTVSGADSGLILLIPLRDANVEAEAVDAAGRLGIGLDGLSTGGYYEQAGPAGILIGYGASPQHSFRSAVEALMSALGPFLARTA
jgi:GntR family transcriptional regulator/MocR family aminotransferase